MLPPLHLPLSSPAPSPPVVSTDAPLRGIVRRGGRASNAEDAAGARRRPASSAAGGGAAAVSITSQNGATRLAAVAAELRGPTSSAGSFARRWQAAVRTSMAHKVLRYERERHLQCQEGRRRKVPVLTRDCHCNSCPLAFVQILLTHLARMPWVLFVMGFVPANVMVGFAPAKLHFRLLFVFLRITQRNGGTRRLVRLV